MISLSDIPKRGGSPLPAPMLVFLAALFTAPFWIGPIGLYEYFSIEVAIWILFAMSFNLLFGYAGLHFFGHGAYLGIGAYAFGLFQQEVGVSGAVCLRPFWPPRWQVPWLARWSRTGAGFISRCSPSPLARSSGFRQSSCVGLPAVKTGCSASRVHHCLAWT